MGSRCANGQETIDGLLDASSACSASVASEVQGVQRAVIVMRLSVTELPLALSIVWVDSNDSDTHWTIHAGTFAIEPLSGDICELTGVCGFAMPAAMHVAFVQHAFCVLLAGSAYELVAVLQRPRVYRFL